MAPSFNRDKVAPIVEVPAKRDGNALRREKRKGPLRKTERAYAQSSIYLLDVVLSHEGVNGTVVGQVLDGLVDVVLELGVALVDGDGVLLAGADLLDGLAGVELLGGQLAGNGAVGDYGVALSDCRALKHSVASL